MGKIIELSPHVSNQIAAGEVVERPASVIKELLENALDAGAKNIEVRIGDGGLSYMVVQDDGCGMDEADVAMAVRRYATSKLKATSDLESIESFGFRGEALPSIASISNMTILSRQQGCALATMAQIKGGQITEIGKASGPLGTRIEVRDLFFNVPARLKFVKSSGSESASIDKLLRAMAFVFADVNFKFFRDNKLVFSLGAGANAALERSLALLGRDTAGFLFPFDEKSELVRLRGTLCAPMQTRRDMQGVHIFVNNRLVSDRKLVAAIKVAYRTLLEVGRHPIAALKIDIEPQEVDVNVHPQKAMVRFVDERRVMSHIISLLGHFLATTPWLRQQAAKELNLSSPQLPSLFRQEPGAREVYDVLLNQNVHEKPILNSPLSYDFTLRAQEMPSQKLLPVSSFSELRVIGQVSTTYLLLASETGLVVIDQHAAHERIRFEQIRKQKKLSLSSSPMLIPITIELDSSEMALFVEHKKDLLDVGIEAEIFGEDRVVVRALPDFIGKENIAGLMRDILSDFSQAGRSESAELIYDHVCATMACHSSIRAGQKMSADEITALLAQLDGIDFGAHCPHGRPVVKTFSQDEMKKWFDRS